MFWYHNTDWENFTVNYKRGGKISPNNLESCFLMELFMILISEEQQDPVIQRADNSIQ